jgi:hypothetical protein
MHFTAVPFAHAPGASCATTKASAAWPNTGAGSTPIMPGLLAAGNAYKSRVACPVPAAGHDRPPPAGRLAGLPQGIRYFLRRYLPGSNDLLH